MAKGGDVELVDVVDADDRVIDTVPRSVMRRDVLRHRAVFILVCDSGGRVLIHRRSERKDIWPGWWDIAVGGVMAPGESPDRAAQRELQEELGLSQVALQPLGTGAYDDADVRLVSASYLCRHDGPFTFSDGEVIESAWIPLSDLVDWLGAHKVLPDSCALVLPFLPL